MWQGDCALFVLDGTDPKFYTTGYNSIGSSSFLQQNNVFGDHGIATTTPKQWA